MNQVQPTQISLTKNQAHAVKALAEGKADAEQQKIAFEWIIYGASGLNVSGFHQGGEEGRRATDFWSGRKFAGEQIMAVIRTPFDKLFPEKPKPETQE